MTPDAVPAVRLDAVSHAYGSAVALKDVSLTLPSASMIGVIGPDGVGKSTLLALAAGVRRLQTGSVEVLGGSMADAAYRRRVCARIAYMPQGLGRNLYPTLSVYENIEFFARLFALPPGERVWRIDELLIATGLKPFIDRPAANLSGGMKQKLSLCCALIHEPDIMILDEPTTGIDPLSRKQFWELIDRIRQRNSGMTVVAATAYMDEAARFDHLVMLNSGRILAEGSPADLKRRTAEQHLEDTFISMLPQDQQRGHRQVIVPPRTIHVGAPAIEAHGLTKRFGAFTAVDAVTMSIEQGEIFGFLGSNGCGKTTTMKMLTGLLPPSEGTALLFGAPVSASAFEVRRQIGYMSQSFSLYAELTVRQNLDMHARLFRLEPKRAQARVTELLAQFGLASVADKLPDSVPLGVRQRLQLAVAVLHEPKILILDEPTSGVDPIARDSFWQLLIDLSRNKRVTIFISTHFVNEAERCDRISLMHAGKVLAVGTPDDLRQAKSATTLEDAFISYLEEADGSREPTADDTAIVPNSTPQGPATSLKAPVFDAGRYWAFALRETMELLRDPIRIAFALSGPLILMVALCFGISFDIEHVRYAALDQDRSPESRELLDQFASSRYFERRPPLSTEADVDRRLGNGELRFALIVPPNYGRDLISGRAPEIGLWLDGANTFRAETSRGYVQGVLASYLADLASRQTATGPPAYPAGLEPRFRYNQAFLSVNAISPGALMMMLIMVPAMLTALGVVREKELGSITNLYATPASRLEFLIGKQLPYIGVAMVSFFMLVALIVWGFGLPISGSFAALFIGAVLYTTAATAFGLVVSAFVRSQIAAIFASAIIVMIPTINFSGMMYPVSALDGQARIMSALFPASYFQVISAGVFNKGLGFGELWPAGLALVGFCLAFWFIAASLLRKQEL